MSRPLICATVTAASTAELRRRRDAVRDADLIELRLDSVADPDVAGALEGRHRPVIVTCRPAWEGGAFEGPEHDRRALLEQALALGADYVDVEWKAGFADLVASAHGQRIVLSMHDFDRTPTDLPAIASAMRATGAQAIKIAVKTERLTDTLMLLDLGASLRREAPAGHLALVIGMGQAGIATRVLASRFGSAWTYAGALNDVGQLTVGDLIEQYHFHSLSDVTRLYGVVGRPVWHSVSPAMHNAAIRATGLDAVYLPLAAADIDDFFAFARRIGLAGASVTIPFKVKAFDCADDVDPIARRVGAVNTLRFKGTVEATNTDIGGFLRPLAERGIVLRGKRASILGAGGSARAVATALIAEGASVTIHARRPEQAETVAHAVEGDVGQWPPPRGSWDLLVNCTPVGMYPHVDASPLNADVLEGSLVYDLIYNPETTRLLRDAAKAGCTTIGGLEMLVGQAREQFRWWTGIEPPASVMHAAASARLMEFRTDEDHVV